MTLDLQQQAQRRMRRAVITLSVIVLVLVAALVVLSVSGGGSDDKAGPAPQPSDTAAPTATPKATLPPDDGGYVAPEQTIKLPDGMVRTKGLPSKYPRTPEGAAAMAVSSVRNAWSLDPDQIRAGILTYASAQYRDQMASAAEMGAKGNREFAGIPKEGPIPSGATLNAWPIGVKYSAVDAYTVDVMVLLRVTHAAKGGTEPTTTLIVSPGRASWEGGDWKSVPTNPNQALPDPVDIGSPHFNEDRWMAIQEGDRL
ncbi:MULTISPECIES: hypothetical protein [unclassified Streptomyces]|uniref:hypothetical protein n=1 Tax=unclassified Streptomyces TaxID=2593676 RepID=UPI0035D934C8